MTHVINRVFPALILTGYSILFSAFALAAENNIQQSEKKQPQATTAMTAKRVVAKKPVLLPGTGVLMKNGIDTFEDENWKWYHRVIYFIGSKSYSAGCYFYDMSMKK